MIKVARTKKNLYIRVPVEDQAAFAELCQRGGNCWWETAPPLIKQFLDNVKPLSEEPLNPFAPVPADGHQLPKTHPLFEQLGGRWMEPL